MHTSDRFLKFAAECQVIAKITPGSETGLSGAGWHTDGLVAPN